VLAPQPVPAVLSPCHVEGDSILIAQPKPLIRLPVNISGDLAPPSEAVQNLLPPTCTSSPTLR
jgi:hypothetical protein